MHSPRSTANWQLYNAYVRIMRITLRGEACITYRSTWRRLLTSDDDLDDQSEILMKRYKSHATINVIVNKAAQVRYGASVQLKWRGESEYEEIRNVDTYDNSMGIRGSPKMLKDHRKMSKNGEIAIQVKEGWRPGDTRRRPVSTTFQR